MIGVLVCVYISVCDDDVFFDFGVFVYNVVVDFRVFINF